MYTYRDIYIYIYIKNLELIIKYFRLLLFKTMRTDSLICLPVWKCLCVSISRSEPSIYFLLNIGYVVYVVYVIYFIYVIYVVVAVVVVYVVNVGIIYRYWSSAVFDQPVFGSELVGLCGPQQYKNRGNI